MISSKILSHTGLFRLLVVVVVVVGLSIFSLIDLHVFCRSDFTHTLNYERVYRSFLMSVVSP